MIKMSKNDAYILNEMIQFYRESYLDPFDKASRSRLNHTAGSLNDIMEGRKMSFYAFRTDVVILNDAIDYYVENGPGSENSQYKKSWRRTQDKLIEAKEKIHEKDRIIRTRKMLMKK